VITERTFTKDWLLAVNESLGWNRQKTQLKNLEKAIAALYLLERLATVKLKFIFKGGDIAPVTAAKNLPSVGMPLVNPFPLAPPMFPPSYV
jgi:hypothetical protein